jgi:hypothetical protein
MQAPHYFPSFSIRSRMGVILMLCEPPGDNEGLENANQKERGLK